MGRAAEKGCPHVPTLICRTGTAGKSGRKGLSPCPSSAGQEPGEGLRPWEGAKARAVPMSLQWSAGTWGRAGTLGTGQDRAVPTSLNWRTGTRGQGLWERVRTRLSPRPSTRQQGRECRKRPDRRCPHVPAHIPAAQDAQGCREGARPGLSAHPLPCPCALRSPPIPYLPSAAPGPAPRPCARRPRTRPRARTPPSLREATPPEPHPRR